MSVTFPKNMQKIALIGGGALVGLMVLYKVVSGSKTIEEEDGESDTSSISSEEYPAERNKRYGSIVRDGDDTTRESIVSDDDEDDDEEFTIGGGSGALRKKNNKKNKHRRTHKKGKRTRSKGRKSNKNKNTKKNKKGHN